MKKIERLDAYLEENGLESVWFARPNSFAWLTGGSNVVDRETDAGVAAVGYDGTALEVVTDTIEADRIETEEVPDLNDVDIVEFPWYDSSLAEALAEHVDGPGAADIDVPGFETVDPTPLRQPLTERDLERYRTLCSETAAAVESVCHELQPEDTEHEVASAIGVALSTRDIEAPVVLVGGAERAQQYRHYTPTNAELGDYVLVSVTTQRAGLHASCTRTVAFDPPEWLGERHETAARVETTALAATRECATSGRTAGDVFGTIQETYETLSFPNEWQLHHQGGAAGFSGREWIATPAHPAEVRIPMAYAWSPSVQGAKSEDTTLVTEDGYDILTETGGWPTKPTSAVGYDLELDRPAVLGLEEIQ